jgi:hypothetical protein
VTGRAELATLLQQLRTPVRTSTPGEPARVVDTEVGASGREYGLSRERMAWFWDQYVAELDVLRDEGEACARRLADAGIRTASRCRAGQGHGFTLRVDELTDARTALDVAGAELALIFNDLTRSQQ